MSRRSRKQTALPKKRTDYSDPQVPQRYVPDRGVVSKVYREYPTAQLFTPEWSVEAAKATVREHELGIFTRSALMIEAMCGDDRVAGCLDTIILGILRLPFTFKLPKTTALAVKAEAFVRSIWSTAAPESELYDLLKSLIVGGLGLAEIVWDTTEDDWTPIGLKIWSLQHVMWREDIRRYIVFTADGELEIEPGNGKWILLTSGLRGHLRGAIRGLWKWWLLRGMICEDWAQHSETLGGAVRVAKIPSAADQVDKDTFVRTLRAMGSDAVIQLPDLGQNVGVGVFDVSLLEAEFDHGAGFERLLLRCEANISVRLLGQAATQENTGTYVSGTVFAQVTEERINGIVGPVEAGLRDQLCRPVCEFNFDDASLAPCPSWDAEPPLDKSALAQTAMNLGQFLLNATMAGYAVDAVALSDRFKLPISLRGDGPLSLQIAELGGKPVTPVTPAPAPPPVQQSPK